MARIRSLALTPLADFPDIGAGGDLVGAIAACLRASGIDVRDGDVLVVAQKIVSKAENRYVDLPRVVPSPRAIELAEITRKDPRLVEVILSESAHVVRAVPEVLIVEHRLGFVVANAGVDQSNLGPDATERALCLPADPDASAEALRHVLVGGTPSVQAFASEVAEAEGGEQLAPHKATKIIGEVLAEIDTTH